jgi:hypothetical protein
MQAWVASLAFTSAAAGAPGFTNTHPAATSAMIFFMGDVLS